MKNVSYKISVFVIISLIAGCAPKPTFFYHSEAEIPYYHSATRTKFELITWDKGNEKINFGVIAASDDDTLSYVLLAPPKLAVTIRELKNANLTFAIPLLRKQVKELIGILEASIENWGIKYDTKNGVSYEFLVTPEQNIIKRTENVASSIPTFKFYYHNTKEARLGSVIFGEGGLQNYFRLSTIEEMQEFLYLLEEALKR